MASSSIDGVDLSSLPPDVAFVLQWNPPKVLPKGESLAPGMSTLMSPPSHMPLPSQIPTSYNTSKLGTTRKAAFYDRHLADHLILKHVVHVKSLVNSTAETVDRSIRDALEKCSLPADTGALITEKQIRTFNWSWQHIMHGELGVSSRYSSRIALNCLPVASTLALYPTHSCWVSMLDWTVDVRTKKWAIADGALNLTEMAASGAKNELLDAIDEEKRSLLHRLGSPLAIWEIKSLTVGAAPVMAEILKIGKGEGTFKWTGCRDKRCRHLRVSDMMEASKDYDPGFDALSSPWKLPTSDPSGAAHPPPNPPRSSPRFFGQDTAGPSRFSSQLHVESSLSSMDTDGNTSVSVQRGTKRAGDQRNDSRSAKKRRKKMILDPDYEPEPTGRKEVNAQSFLQQSWAQAVRNRSTIVVLHSGNHEIIGIRHRRTQTLYISDVIEPHSCTPAYDRARQDRDAEATAPPAAPVAGPSENGGMGEDDGPDRTDDHRKPPKSGRGKGRGGRSVSRGKHGKQNSRAGDQTSGNQAILEEASGRNLLYIHLFYDIYASPHPSIFRRKIAETTPALTTEQAPTPPPSPGHEEAHSPDHSFRIVMTSELNQGSTGIVHTGTMKIGSPGLTRKVAVKLGFSKSEKATLAKEYELYTHLRSKKVQGIPHAIGLFVEDELVDGEEGPYALVMSHAGVSIIGREKSVSHTAFPPVYQHVYSNCIPRRSLLATLNSIHRAGVVHGDIHPRNLCVTTEDEAFILDFSHAKKSESKAAKQFEVKELCETLGIKARKSNTEIAPAHKPAASLRIKAAEEKAEAEQRRAERQASRNRRHKKQLENAAAERTKAMEEKTRVELRRSARQASRNRLKAPDAKERPKRPTTGRHRRG